MNSIEINLSNCIMSKYFVAISCPIHFYGTTTLTILSSPEKLSLKEETGTSGYSK